MTRLASVLAFTALLTAVPLTVSAARCPRECRHLLKAEMRACRVACPKHWPGRGCRLACGATFEDDKTTCRAASNPSAPYCGETTTSSSTTTTSSSVAGSSSTVTTTSSCPPATAAYCGAADCGYGGMPGCPQFLGPTPLCPSGMTCTATGASTCACTGESIPCGDPRLSGLTCNFCKWGTCPLGMVCGGVPKDGSCGFDCACH